jgi:hypothetical protein
VQACRELPEKFAAVAPVVASMFDTTPVPNDVSPQFNSTMMNTFHLMVVSRKIFG